ncbi:unnamed protein product [Sphacelaria rigidula]
MLLYKSSVGEWSLATDTCAMWLGGWQDQLPRFPQVRHVVLDTPLAPRGVGQ